MTIWRHWDDSESLSSQRFQDMTVIRVIWKWCNHDQPKKKPTARCLEDGIWCLHSWTAAECLSGRKGMSEWRWLSFLKLLKGLNWNRPKAQLFIWMSCLVFINFFPGCFFSLVLDLFLEQHDPPSKAYIPMWCRRGRNPRGPWKDAWRGSRMAVDDQWLYRSVGGSHVDVCWSERRK